MRSSTTKQGSPTAKRRATTPIKEEMAALKRERILETATQLFLRHSFHGCSMDAIAQAMGVTKPFIYYQFKDKSEILAAICSQGAELSLAALDQAEHLHATAPDRMRWFCHHLTRVVVDRGHYLAVYLRETANLEDTDRKAILKLRAEIDERLTQIVASGASSGEFTVEDPAIAARAITGMISNSFQWYRKDRSPVPEVFIETMTEIAMRTLYHRDSTRSEFNSGVLHGEKA